MPPAVYEKINERHIDKLLENSEKEDLRGYSYAREGRFLKYGLTLVVIAVLILLTYFLAKDDKFCTLILFKFWFHLVAESASVKAFLVRKNRSL